MQRFYFTYGLEGYPFRGGWTVIRAESLDIAIKAFRLFHPDKKGYHLIQKSLSCKVYWSTAPTDLKQCAY